MAEPEPTPQSRHATSALVTALIGVPIVPSVLGLLALREIDRSGGRVGGTRAAALAIVLGIVNLVVLLVLVLVLLPWAWSLWQEAFT